jgi:cobalt-zinc-cadmium efflux system outer membrane protein
MRRIRLLWILAALMGQGSFSVQADLPAQPRDDGTLGQSAQNELPASIAPASPPPAATVRGRFFEGFRRPGPTPATQAPERVAESPVRNPDQDRNRPQPARPAVGSTAVARPKASSTRYDGPVRRAQATSGDMSTMIAPGISPLQPPTDTLTPLTIPPAGGQSISLQAALYGAITSNPDLVTLRQGNALVASAEAVEVARHFPTTLNPTLWIDYRPITLVPNGTFGTSPPAGGNNHGFYHFGQGFIYISLRQPIELGHQTTHRFHIAEAAFDQQKWLVVQAELTTLVQTYRFFQTAAYRREKYRLSRELADFNDRLSESLQKRMEANQVQAADVALARVESRATRQLVKAARQDYFTALTDLRNQIGIPEQAGAIEPLGEFTLPPYIPPIDEQVMIQEALQSRPDIHAARAQVNGTHSAVSLAKGDRIPTPIIGPQYEQDEAGVQYIGFVLIGQLPIWNNGKPLVLQREAEHRRAKVAYEQAQQRAVAQVRAAVAKWNGATDLVNESAGLSKELNKEVGVLDRLFDAGQTDLTKLMQARQRLIQLENSELDAVWQATGAQADLLLALGMPSLIHAMLSRAERDAGTGNAPAPDQAPAPTNTPNPIPTPATTVVRP